MPKHKDKQKLDYGSTSDSESDLSVTKALFEQLENGYKEGRTFIEETIKEGADLNARNGDEDCPIHVAANNMGSNTEALGQILKSFSDSAARKTYLNVKNADGQNVLDIFAETDGENWSENDELNVMGINTVLSYLLEAEQKQYLKQTAEKIHAKKHAANAQPPALDLSELGLHNSIYEIFENVLNQNKFIPVCEQRRREEAQNAAAIDSDDEALGAIGEVESTKGFVARVSYKEKVQADGSIESIPTIEVIPSAWRLDTATEGSNQGDHVIAYVVLLQSLATCKGENIKTVPDYFYEMAKTALPDEEAWFLEEKNKVKTLIAEKRTARKATIAHLEHVNQFDKKTLSTIENSLKKAEIEEVARHLEKVSDKFISSVNLLEGESFSQKRKEKINADGRLKDKICSFVDDDEKVKDAKFSNFRTCLKTAITEGLAGKDGAITDARLDGIAKAAQNKRQAAQCEVPQSLRTQAAIKTFLTSITPLKKYHEGYVIERIGKEIASLESAAAGNKENFIKKIAVSCAQLFDYPQVNKPDIHKGKTIERTDDEYVLYQSIPRHMVIIFSAFKELKKLSKEEKGVLYETFCEQVLKLQLWQDHSVIGNDEASEVALTKEVLMGKIGKFADFDAQGNVAMKAQKDYPKEKYSKQRQTEYDLKEIRKFVAKKIGEESKLNKWKCIIDKLVASKETPEKLCERLEEKEENIRKLSKLRRLLLKAITDIDEKADMEKKQKIQDLLDSVTDFATGLKMTLESAEKKPSNVVEPRDSLNVANSSKADKQVKIAN